MANPVLSRADLVPALRAWLYFAGSAEPREASLRESFTWLRLLWEAGADHLPLGLVHDLGLLLLRGQQFRFASSQDLATWPAAERPLRLTHEDRLLGRWALDPSVLEAHVTLAGMRPEHRTAVAAHAVGLALSHRLRGRAGLCRGNPAHLRALPIEELLSPTPPPSPEWIAWCITQIQICHEALLGTDGRRTHLLRPEDLWEIAHLPALPKESARVALRELNGAVARIGALAPDRALELARRAREVPVDRDEADNYPTGGFDAVSTKGSFENLVRSEVGYVGVSAVGSIDLFDIRYVEGEILYYTRDESPLLDARRNVTLVIDRPAELRHKVPLLSAQTIVIAQALCLVLGSDLTAIHGPHGTHVHIVFRAPSPEDRSVAEDERARLALCLEADLAHGRVELSVIDDWANVPQSGRIVLSTFPQGQAAESANGTWVRIHEDEGRICLPPERAGGKEEKTTFDLRSGDAALRALCDELLAMIR